MFRVTNPVTSALILAIAFATSSSAQQQNPATAENTDNYVTEKSFKSKVFEVKYRDPNSLARVLKQLGSGFKGATISANSDFKTITARDFPENLATIEEAIKRLDTPAAPSPNIELHMHALIASNTGSSTADVPAELRAVLNELRGTLNYRNYELAASVVQRLTETGRILQGSGTAEIPSGNPGAPNMSMPYEYYINNVAMVQNAVGAPSVQISDFAFSTVSDKDRARIQTALNLRDGEKVVVGTATIRNRALVIVLTAKLIK
ncbi:MAG: secretin N-terminal domain-containing protein [Pyrinomonadaceae bacterium]